MKKHEKKWRMFPENPQMIKKHIIELTETRKEHIKLKADLSALHNRAIKLKTDNTNLLKKLEKRVKGIHAGEEKYIKDYK